MIAGEEIRRELGELANLEKASHLMRFFKTGPGQYGEGDLFRGITVPVIRGLVKRYKSADLSDAELLLGSPFHEDRLLALLLLVRIYSRGDDRTKEKVFAFYLASTRRINNWDLVDASAEHIVGDYLFARDRECGECLTLLARSGVLWERRIAVMSTFHFIKRGRFDETLRLVELLLGDREDLIHKAAGWMLREIGKRDLRAEEEFLRAHYGRMPRTMLRYAIERFAEPVRKEYLEGRIQPESGEIGAAAPGSALFGAKPPGRAQRQKVRK